MVVCGEMKIQAKGYCTGTDCRKQPSEWDSGTELLTSQAAMWIPLLMISEVVVRLSTIASHLLKNQRIDRDRV